MATLDRLILGDNPFLGLGPVSEERARQQLMRFPNAQKIARALEEAKGAGVRSFMCSTHERIGEVCDLARAGGPLRDLDYLPCIPHARKYANAVGELGVLETLKRYSTGGIVSTLFRGAVGALTQDVFDLMKILVDAEMKRFEGLRTPVVFLQNIVTDLILGAKAFEVFGELHRYVREHHRAEVGFVTMNLPALVDALETTGISNPIVCATINKLGAQMGGGLAAYERTLRERRFRPVAMGVFAGGLIPPEEALEYIAKERRIEAIVFGASTAAHVRNTREILERLDAKHR